MTDIDTSTAAVAALMDGVPGTQWIYANEGGEHVVMCGDLYVCTIHWMDTMNHGRSEASARFIAAARKLVPALAAERDALIAENERMRETQTEMTALVAAATDLRDQIARWHDGAPPAGPDESRALFEALDGAITAWEAAQK